MSPIRKDVESKAAGVCGSTCRSLHRKVQIQWCVNEKLQGNLAVRTTVITFLLVCVYKLENLKRMDRTRDLCLKRMIILKRILKKEGVRMWCGLIWLRIVFIAISC